MRTTAASAINAGMSRSRLARADDGRQVGRTADTFGRLVPGAAADIAIWDGSPLDLPVGRFVLVDGKEAFCHPLS